MSAFVGPPSGYALKKPPGKSPGALSFAVILFALSLPSFGKIVYYLRVWDIYRHIGNLFMSTDQEPMFLSSINNLKLFEKYSFWSIDRPIFTLYL